MTHWFLALLIGAFTWASCSARLDAEDGGNTEFKAAHQRMIEQQLKAAGRGIENPRVLEALANVPRHRFVPEEYRQHAYSDQPLPIGHGQTISQPYIVAFMTEQLDPDPGDRVLEIGTGSGYQAAVLGELVAEVYSIEILEPLAEGAKKTLADLGYDNVHVKAGDGYAGWPEHAPFDAVIVTCAPNDIPQPLIDQLKNGGRMIIPTGDAYDQQLYLLRKKDDKITRESVLPVRFVPMTGKVQKE